ncbi:MAG: hypothetical protein R3B70_30485 [Polyangiaceae bacterium]
MSVVVPISESVSVGVVVPVAPAPSAPDYSRARGQFQAAYDLYPERALLFNIASCDLRMGDTARACGLFRKYVAESDPGDQRTQDVQQQVATRCKNIP